MATELRNYRKRNYEELELKDDFMFGKVMQDEDLCKKTLEALLGMPVKDITRLEKQKAIDLDILESGAEYQKLKNSYIIFICTFDPFGKNLSRYTFENVCLEDQGIRLNDGVVKIFFNTTGDKAGIGPEARILLEYLEHKAVANELTRRLDEAVEDARRNEKWRLEYMKERVIYMEAREDGREEERKESRRNMAEMLVKTVDRAMKNFHVDLTGACQGLGYRPEEYEEAKKMIGGEEEQGTVGN